MFDAHTSKLRILLVLAGSRAFQREEMVISRIDVFAAIHVLWPNEQLSPCPEFPTQEDRSHMYKLMFNAFGPGINLTTSAFGVIRGLVHTWNIETTSCPG